MKILSILFLVNAIAGSAAFVPSRIAKGPSSFVVRINQGANDQSTFSSSSLQLSSRSEELIIATSPPVSFSPDHSDLDLMRQLKVRYKWLSRRNFLTLAFFQAAILASGADILTQTMESGSVDYSHVAAMATIAATMSGVFNAMCLRELEAQWPGKGNIEVAMKTIIHATIIASIINSAYLACVPLLADDIYQWTGLPDGNPLSAWNLPEFITLTKLEIAMFIPYNTLAFSFVPPQVRPLTHAMISASFNVAVSAVTLGYYDIWCSRAMETIG